MNRLLLGVEVTLICLNLMLDSKLKKYSVKYTFVVNERALEISIKKKYERNCVYTSECVFVCVCMLISK